MAKQSVAKSKAPKGRTRPHRKEDVHRGSKEPPKATLIGFDDAEKDELPSALEDVHRLLVLMGCNVRANDLAKLPWSPQKTADLFRVQRMLHRLATELFPGCRPEDVVALKNEVKRAGRLSREVAKWCRYEEERKSREGKAAIKAAEIANDRKRASTFKLADSSDGAVANQETKADNTSPPTPAPDLDGGATATVSAPLLCANSLASAEFGNAASNGRPAASSAVNDDEAVRLRESDSSGERLHPTTAAESSRNQGPRVGTIFGDRPETPSTATPLPTDDLARLAKQPNPIRIPADRQTRPMSLSEAARFRGYLMKGKGAEAIRARARRLAREIKNRPDLAHKVNRQTFIFNMDLFPESVRNKVSPPT